IRPMTPDEIRSSISTCAGRRRARRRATFSMYGKNLAAYSLRRASRSFFASRLETFFGGERWVLRFAFAVGLVVAMAVPISTPHATFLACLSPQRSGVPLQSYISHRQRIGGRRFVAPSSQ